MDELASGAIQLELKYCERCGGLWLRPKGSDLVFCACCARAMAGLTSLLPRIHSRDDRYVSAAVQSGFWSEGGNA